MKAEIHLNGTLAVQLRPETDIEKLVLTQMAELAERGKKVKLERFPNGVVEVSVEK